MKRIEWIYFGRTYKRYTKDSTRYIAKYCEEKKPWISADILDVMEKRKRAKNTQSYDVINRQVKWACKIAKGNWLEEQCQEMENLEKQHITRQTHENIRRVTNRRKTTETTGIMDKYDNMCFEEKKHTSNRLD